VSRVLFAEVDGRRAEIDRAALSEESRCDACGEFIADNRAIQVHTRIYYQGREARLGIVDLHPMCVTRLDWPGIIAGQAQQVIERQG
jgi:hypothetical protein